MLIYTNNGSCKRIYDFGFRILEVLTCYSQSHVYLEFNIIGLLVAQERWDRMGYNFNMLNLYSLIDSELNEILYVLKMTNMSEPFKFACFV